MDGKWIQIFRGGKQIDSLGRKHNGDALIDQAISSFSVGRHTPPVVVGHPVSNSPAFGWVTELRKNRDGQAAVLEARLNQVAPEFTAAVQQGRYKKRSASFYPDGSLRHVGFLGGMPPAVKGLRDIGFSDDGQEAITFEFQESEGEEKKMSDFADAFEKFKAFIGLAREAKDAGLVPADPPANNPTSFSEADLEKARKEAKEAAAAEFAEEKARLAREKRRAEIEAQVKDKVKEGVIPPAFVEGGLVDFVVSIDQAGPVEFGETKAGLVDKFFEFMGQAKELGLFKEVATRDKAAEFAEGNNPDNTLGDQIAARVSLSKEV